MIIYFYMILILLILTTVSTYAWFALTRTARVSNLSVFINADPDMLISLDPNSDDDWTQHISYEDMFEAEYKLLPATWSDKDQRFYGAVYSFDGRRINSWEPLTDERHANSESRDNYYVKATIYAKAGTDIDVLLADAGAGDVDITTASGTYLLPGAKWNESEIRHDNVGNGAESAIRIGLRITRLNEDLSESTTEPSVFYIYEPNYDRHMQPELSGYVATPSIDGAEHLISEERILKQSSSMWGDTTPVQKDQLAYVFGSFDEELKLFHMKREEVVKIEMYIWLEGQDVDCTNAIADARLFGNIQFQAVPTGGGGLVPIE